MPVTGPLYPGTVGETPNGLGVTVSWVNPTNVEADDGSAASFTTFSPNKVSQYLLCTNYNFAGSIPAAATIIGIQVGVKKSSSSSGSVASNIVDGMVQLLYGSGTLPTVGNNKLDSLTVWPGSLTYEYYGSIGPTPDLWGWASADASHVRDSTFGVAVQGHNTGSGDGTGNVDAVPMWIWWTLSGNMPILSGGQMGFNGLRTGGRLYRHAYYSFPARKPGIILPDRRIHRCQTLAARA